MTLSSVAISLLSLSVLSALAYGFHWLRAAPSVPRSAAKTLAIGSLAVLSFLLDGPWQLTIALGLSAAGDFFLSRDGDKAFLAGLASFLAAHVAYVWIMTIVAGGYEAHRLDAATIVAVYAGLMLRWLWPHLGEMRGAVIAYVIAIYAMGVVAAGAPASLWPIWVGAALFVASDSVLAAELFPWREKPRRWTAPVIWSTYYAAQIFLAAAFLHTAFGA